MRLSSLRILFFFASFASIPVFGADLFPVTSGTKWQLASAAIADRMTVTVQGTEVVSGVKRTTLQIASPWSSYGFLVKSTDSGIMLDGIAFGAGVTKLSESDPFFPVGAAGQVFQGQMVRVTIKSTDLTVSTPLGTIAGVTLYLIQFGSGDSMVWYVKPGQGIVQFAEGPYAFKLESQTIQPEPPPVQPPPTVFRACPLIGIEPNPLASSDFSYAARESAMQSAVQRGKNFTVISASWGEIERSPRVYDLTMVRETLDRAARYNLPVAFTLKTIDTGLVSVPRDLAGKPWTDAVLQARFKDLLKALVPLMGSNVRWLHLGNEVDVYLTARPGEIAGYQQFYNAGAAQAKALRPNIAVGLVFAFDTYRQTNDVFRSMEAGLSHIAFTYYAVKMPTAASPGMHRDPSSAAMDILDMIAAARGRNLVLTEAGYSSATAAGSSFQKQADFYAAMFATLKTSGGKVQAANFSFLSDIPRSVAQQLMTYMPSSSQAYVDWLAELGTIDGQGVDKPSALRFRDNATFFKSGPVCQ